MRDTWDSRFMWLEPLLNLHQKLFACRERGCHHLFHRDNVWERGCKVADPLLSITEKTVGGRGLQGDLEKKQMELIIL